jgi:hypothetical protein
MFDTNLSILQGANQLIPPDSSIAAGPNHIIPAVNLSISIYNKTSPFTLVATSTLNTFFGANVVPNLPLTPSNTDIVSDPWIVFDQFANKFVLSLIRIKKDTVTPANSTGWVMLAISKTNSPTTLTNTSWDFFIYNRTQNAGVTPTFPDYAKLGYDNLAYYISENNFTINTSAFVNSKVFAIRKSNLATTIDTGVSLQCIPVQSYESTSNAFYCASTQFIDGIQLFAIDKTTNLLITSQKIPLSTVNNVVLSTQPNLAFLKLESGSIGSSQGAVLRRNGTDRIWIAFGCSLTGVTDVLGNPKNLVRWLEIDLGSWPVSGSPSIVQNQIVVANGNDNIFFPRINVDTFNNMSIGCSISSINRFPGIAMFARLATDPPSTTRAITVLKPGLNSYQIDFGSGRNRWGDYTGLVIDPSDGITFWLFSEYAATGPVSGMGWNTSVARYSLDTTSPYSPNILSSFESIPPSLLIEPNPLNPLTPVAMDGGDEPIEVVPI